MYLLEDLNAKDRVRDKKRNTYQQFLAYIKNLPESGFSFPKDKSKNLPIIFRQFTGAGAAYDKLMREYKLKQRSKELFNGVLVSEWTGRQGKELGELMKEVRDRKGRLGNPTSFHSWVANHTQEEIKKETMFYHNRLMKQTKE
jgi:hypothetical protein